MDALTDFVVDSAAGAEATGLLAEDKIAEIDAHLAAAFAEIERKVRTQIAADFQAYGKQHDSLSWGQAFYIARDGLNGGAR